MTGAMPEPAATEVSSRASDPGPSRSPAARWLALGLAALTIAVGAGFVGYAVRADPTAVNGPGGAVPGAGRLPGAGQLPGAGRFPGAAAPNTVPARSNAPAANGAGSAPTPG